MSRFGGDAVFFAHEGGGCPVIVQDAEASVDRIGARQLAKLSVGVCSPLPG